MYLDYTVFIYHQNRHVGRYMKSEYRYSYAKATPIWLNNVLCNGTERDINDCQHQAWGVHNCGHNKDVSISCYSDIYQPRKLGLCIRYTIMHL